MADVSDDFKRALQALVDRLMAVDGTRFYVYVPWVQLLQDTGSHGQLDRMVGEYTETYWALDPMHPSRFEDLATVVVSNSMLMPDAAWRDSAIFKGFYQPNGYFHNCDIFFKQQGRIVAVLSLVRRDESKPFTPAEVSCLNQVQPFIEYSLGAIYVSRRVISRTGLAAEFHLTARELDVVEIAITGISNKALCRHLGISLPTLRSHVQSIYAKVGVRSSSELIARLVPVQFS